MDVRNNHLVADIAKVEESLRGNYTPVPTSLRDEAERELAGREQAYVNKSAALKDWAAKKLAKQRTRAKIAKSARKRNR